MVVMGLIWRQRDQYGGNEDIMVVMGLIWK